MKNWYDYKIVKDDDKITFFVTKTRENVYAVEPKSSLSTYIVLQMIMPELDSGELLGKCLSQPSFQFCNYSDCEAETNWSWEIKKKTVQKPKKKKFEKKKSEKKVEK